MTSDPDLRRRAEQAVKDAKWNLGDPLPEWSVTEAVSFIRVDEGQGYVAHISNHRSGQRGPRTANFIANAPNLVRFVERLLALVADQAQQIDRVLEQRDHEIALGQDEFRRANRAEAALLAARRLPEKWLWQGAAIDTVHATMSTGYHACAAELLAAFDAPQNRAKGPCT